MCMRNLFAFLLLTIIPIFSGCGFPKVEFDPRHRQDVKTIGLLNIDNPKRYTYYDEGYRTRYGSTPYTGTGGATGGAIHGALDIVLRHTLSDALGIPTEEQRCAELKKILEGAGFDLIDPEGGKWEVRSISRGGVYFCPSYMVGSGRHFEEAGFISKLSEIRGYIIADIESFPNIPFWIIPADQVRNWWNERKLGTTSKISREWALELLRKSKPQ